MVKWVITCHRPFKAIVDPPLQDNFRMCYSKVDIVHPMTLLRDCRDVHKLCKATIVTILKSHNGRLHIAVDGWLSPNKYSILGLVCIHYVQPRIEAFTLAFVRMRKSHTGKHLAQAFHKVLVELEIEKKFLR
ncbi:hypothetical protein MPER_00223, partial [Moniliophthora perniciosa FA553]